MFGYNHYVPILKAKDGEFGALSELPEEIKSRITPLIDIFNSDSKIPLEKRLIKIANKIERSWGNERPIFVDLFGIDLKERVLGGDHPLTFIFDLLRKLNVKAIPLIGFDRDEAYVEAIQKTVKADNKGICIRLLTDDMEDTYELADNIESLLSDLDISYEDAHLMLDFRELKIDKIRVATGTAINVIGKIPHINNWSTLTVAASGFPGSLREIDTLSSGKLPRTDYLLWKLLIKRRKEIERLPSFGDYGIQHPDLLELDWKVIPLVPNIRYTLPDEWLIIRGGSNKKYGWHQSHQLSKELVNMAEYYGETFCWGDNYISLCSDESVGPGNMTTWRKIGTNHHITLVSSQIANTVVL
jgi:hypothetical protein